MRSEKQVAVADDDGDSESDRQWRPTSDCSIVRVSSRISRESNAAKGFPIVSTLFCQRTDERG
jgi:hypothetical protein